MSRTFPAFDPLWETEIYGQGRHLNRYPYDAVVSFIFRNAPRDRPRHDIRVLDFGCGAGNNLWFIAREGFQAAGVDGSATAIAYARRRLHEEGLVAELQVGDFSRLSFADDQFDLVIDRGSLTCLGLGAARQAMAEVLRVTRPGGKLFCNPYSDRHSSHASGRPGPDGLTVQISDGTLMGVGGICFRGRREVEDLFRQGWQVESLKHVESVEEREPGYLVHSEWHVIARKVS